jgi:hypothetical protein
MLVTRTGYHNCEEQVSGEIHMIRIIIITAVILLAYPEAHAQDNSEYLPGTGPGPQQRELKRQQLQSVDFNATPREYEALTRRNQKILKKMLRSYTNNTLKSIGMPEQGISLVGSAAGLVTQGARLKLNESGSLALELRDVNDSERNLYFGVTLDW